MVTENGVRNIPKNDFFANIETYSQISLSKLKASLYIFCSQGCLSSVSKCIILFAINRASRALCPLSVLVSAQTVPIANALWCVLVNDGCMPGLHWTAQQGRVASMMVRGRGCLRGRLGRASCGSQAMCWTCLIWC